MTAMFEMKKFCDDHTKLYHYTSLCALNGMLESNQLWATHIRYMNDNTEYLHAQNLFTEKLTVEIRGWLTDSLLKNPRLKVVVDGNGGIVAQSKVLCSQLLKAMYNVAGDEFYVLSFSAKQNDPYTEVNGLLSQWRAYGREHGVMLVFDTLKLCEMLSHESKKFQYIGPLNADVVYSHDQRTIQTELGPMFDELLPYCEHLIFGLNGVELPPKKAMQAFISISTRFKHRAFFEEREVRIVLPRINDAMKLVRAGAHPLPEKLKEFRNSDSGRIPYIRLFGEGFSKLPIEKIVVGPHKDKDNTAKELRNSPLIRDITVVVSDIPYV